MRLTIGIQTINQWYKQTKQGKKQEKWHGYSYRHVNIKKHRGYQFSIYKANNDRETK